MSKQIPKLYKIKFVAEGPNGEEVLLDEWITKHEPISKRIGPKLLNCFLIALKKEVEEKGSEC